MADNTKIEAAIFDMDGVLCDSEPLINAAAVEMFREKGLDVSPGDFLPFVGTGEDRYISGVAELHNFPLDITAAKKRAYEIYLEMVPQKLTAFEGAIELVEACRSAGLRVAVASSADFIKIEANLAKIGLPPALWDAVASSEDVVHKKPAPDIFLAAARKLNLRPSQCVVIEDAVNGVDAAKAAGMNCVAVCHTFAPEKLARADLVRDKISAVSVSDLTVGHPAPPVLVPPPILPVVPRPLVWGFWATLGLTLAVMIGDTIAQSVMALFFAGASKALGHSLDWSAIESNGLFLALATTAGAPVAIGLSWLFAWLRKGLPPQEYLGLRPVSGRQLWRWFLVLVAFVAISDLVTVLLGRPVVPEFMHQIYETAVFLPLLLVALIIAAPLAEEFVFRGFMFAGLARSSAGPVGATIITSAVWAALHMQYDFHGVSQIFAAGLLMGYVRWKTGSLYTCIFLHAAMNLIATFELLFHRHFF
jgi:HAD superfamily hydrolase (TIGR01509 family)